MNKYNLIYEENKKLDASFGSKYGDGEEIFRKNVLALLVELGEYAQETRCFKYWSIKGMNEKDIVLEELADCILLCLYFCNHLNIDIRKYSINSKETDINKMFIHLFRETSMLEHDSNEERVMHILTDIIKSGYILGFSDDDIIDHCLRKIEKNFKRLSSVY